MQKQIATRHWNSSLKLTESHSCFRNLGFHSERGLSPAWARVALSLFGKNSEPCSLSLLDRCLM